jgi:hypothetical protein
MQVYADYNHYYYLYVELSIYKIEEFVWIIVYATNSLYRGVPFYVTCVFKKIVWFTV